VPVPGALSRALEGAAKRARRKIDQLFDADKRGLVVKLRDLNLLRNLRVPTAVCASRALKNSTAEQIE
jgi:hypothetical protein